MARKSTRGKGKAGAGRAAVQRRVEERLDALYAELPRLECKGLCAHSCIPIEMAPGERDRIRRETGVEIPPGDDLIAKGHTSCVALKDGRCTVHPLRPMICRQWGIDETMPCPHGCLPEGGWMNRLESHRFALRTYLIAGWPAKMDPLTPKQVAEHLRRDEVRAMLAEAAEEARPLREAAERERQRQGRRRWPWRR